MNSTKALLANPAAVLILAAAGVCGPGGFARAQEVRHLSITQPGGMPGVLTNLGIERVTNGVSVTWDGPSGYYQLFQKLGLTDAQWQPVGGLNASRKATITTLYSNAFFRVSGPAPIYAGAAVCLECHESTHTTESTTRHAGAFTNALFVLRGGHTNDSCLPCHTVGYGLPTGFIGPSDFRSTNQLAGVQCENCHGPAANHAANPEDFIARPRVEVAATVCGGCHTKPELPTYEEWLTSGHATVTEPDMNPNSCGRCHIGPARLAMLKGKLVPQNDHNVAVSCAVCHDPHAVHVFANVLNEVHTNVVGGFTVVITNTQLGAVYTNQLRNPLSSTNDYFLTTADVFSSKYDPNINVCAQCHNHRGASWSRPDRPPHHSPQYNILLGTIGELETGSVTATNSVPGTHHLVEKQCVGCHMQTEEFQNPIHPGVGYGPTDHTNAIIGLVWNDVNRSGTTNADLGEPPLTNITIYLYSGTTILATNITDTNGHFGFTTNNVKPGTYNIVVTDLTGELSTRTWTQTYDNDGLQTQNTVSVSVTTNSTAQVGFSYDRTVPFHDFKVAPRYGVCVKCHGSAANAQILKDFILTPAITNLVNSIKSDLDTWAATKAPESLRTKYGSRAWEYTNPGDLSPGGPGPNATEQTLIRDNIKIARFNLYLVVNDGSVGVHNPQYCLRLLMFASDRVRQELNN